MRLPIPVPVVVAKLVLFLLDVREVRSVVGVVVVGTVRAGPLGVKLIKASVMGREETVPFVG